MAIIEDYLKYSELADACYITFPTNVGDGAMAGDLKSERGFSEKQAEKVSTTYDVAATSEQYGIGLLSH